MDSANRKTTPIPALTRAEVRELDRLAIEELGIPGEVLMENAGRGAAEAILRAGAEGRLGRFRGAPGERVAILCGGGNNAGDGYVVARHLDDAELEIVLCETSAPEKLSPDAGVFRAVTRAMGLPHLATPDAAALAAALPELAGVSLVVDALLGTGFQGELRERLGSFLELARKLARREDAAVVALDVPSGLDVDTGAADDRTLHASLTLTFAAPKVGFDLPAARAVTGAIEVISIGAPSSLVGRVRR